MVTVKEMYALNENLDAELFVLFCAVCEHIALALTFFFWFCWGGFKS